MAQSILSFRRIARDYLHPREAKQTLRHLLRKAVGDEYARRDKTSRDYPRKKQERPAGKPKIKPAKAIKQKNG